MEQCTLFVGISGIIENFVFHSQEMSGLVSLPSVRPRTIQCSLFATLQRNSSICFSGKIAGRPDELPDVTKTGNGEWGMGNREWGMGNGEWDDSGEWEIKMGI